MNQTSHALPQFFKGIALFTPGGDLVYCIDPEKRNRWHLHLCAVLQDALDLPEPPHFLVPCYTATLDRWFDPRLQQVQVSAEAHTLVLRHQALLNAVFGTRSLLWQVAPHRPGVCDPIVMSGYRQQFPQLWDDHDLIIRYGQSKTPRTAHAPRSQSLAWSPSTPTADASGYVLRLFVSGHSAATERILKNLHQLLEQSLHHPYTLRVIDISRHPDQAETDQITATPTLLKVWPLPVKRIVGDLDNMSKVLQILVSPEA